MGKLGGIFRRRHSKRGRFERLVRRTGFESTNDVTQVGVEAVTSAKSDALEYLEAADARLTPVESLLSDLHNNMQLSQPVFSPDRFFSSDGTPNTFTYVGTGDGTLEDVRATPDAPAETWTLTFTDATNFDVTGGTSGAQAAGVVDTAYDNGIVSFIIVDGATPFIATDEFTFDVDVAANPGRIKAYTQEEVDAAAAPADIDLF